MRRIAMGVGLYLAGLSTLPLMYFAVTIAPPLAAQQDEAPFPAAAPLPGPSVAQVGGVEQAAEVGNRNLRPVPADIGAVVFDEPMPDALQCPPEPEILLPVRAEMLVSDVPDASEAETIAALRAGLRKVIDQKAALLNAAALEAEIRIQERQIVELQALQELQRLKRSLTELSEEFPHTEAGRRAKLMLMNSNPVNVAPSYGLRPNWAPPYQPYEEVAEPFAPRLQPNLAPTPTEDAENPFGGFAIPPRKPATPRFQPTY
jgi:hypothetical protein